MPATVAPATTPTGTSTGTSTGIDDMLSEVRDGIRLVTFNRPQARNAFTFAMYERLADLYAQAEADRRSAPFCSPAPATRAFASGADIAQFRAFATPEDAVAYEERVGRVIGAPETCGKPTIAAIAGARTGGGGIASACDIRIRAPNARFGFRSRARWATSFRWPTSPAWWR